MQSGTRLYLRAGIFWQSEKELLAGTNAPIYCFLITHGDKHILFDLGMRQDWENLPPATIKIINMVIKVDMKTDVNTFLDTDDSGLGIRSKDISTIIWSHNHFDHTGDPSLFPPTTTLVVGPGVKENSWPGYPSNPEAQVPDSDIAGGRPITEISFKDGLKIGSFDAVDFFGDGSFYLLNAPGHSVGHICGLARVTTGPDTFVLMGADSCHHIGVLRPSEYLPLPATISPSPLEQYRHLEGGCPGALVQALHPGFSATKPFFQITKHVNADYEEAQKTVKKLEELDAAENVLTVLGHDESLVGRLDLFPKPLNDWKAKETKVNVQWAFCKDFKVPDTGLPEGLQHSQARIE